MSAARLRRARLRRSGGWIALLVGFAAMACGRPEPPPAAPANARLATFERQVRSAEAELAEWRPWFRELEALEAVTDCRSELCVSARTQRLMWNEALARRLADPSILDGTGDCCGPLLTIVDFKRQLDAVGIELLVTIVPPLSAVYPERLDIPVPIAPGATPPLLDREIRRLYVALERAGVEVCDLLPDFLAQRDRGQPIEGGDQELLFQRKDPHWTSLGSGVAARTLAARIRQYPWFGDVAARQGEAVLDETERVETRRGSIALQLERAGRPLADGAEERVIVRDIRVRGERWRFEDRDAPIVVLGDSFSSPQHGLPGALLRELRFRLDFITVLGGLPTAGLKALRLRQDQLAGKRLVVWAITSYSLVAHERWRPVDVLGDARIE